jgi:hypothetical protein
MAAWSIITSKGKVDELIIPLRTVIDNERVLDKKSTSYADILDPFRLAMKFYRFLSRTY